jgi:hypothetical protein
MFVFNQTAEAEQASVALCVLRKYKIKKNVKSISSPKHNTLIFEKTIYINNYVKC